MEQNDQPNQVNSQNAPQTIQPPQSVLPKNYIFLIGISFAICLFGIGLFFLYIGKPPTVNSKVTSILQFNLPTQPQAKKVTSSNNKLLSIQGSPKNINKLPLGDNKYTTSGPKKGSIYLCNVQQGGGGGQNSGHWIEGNTWDMNSKPVVSGKISWPNAQFSNTISGGNRILSGNDLPVNATTGIFPIQSTDIAYQYDRNPNTIEMHTFSLTLPVNPIYSETPNCMGGEVGVMINGVPLFNGFDAEHRDAAAHEIQDSCDGHPQENGEYHYHSLSSCLNDIHETSVIGFALDGYPITGPVLPNGNYLTTNDLDECHGMTSEINLEGKKATMYHYVMTEDFPYSVSCFHAKPVRMQIIQTGQNGSPNNQGQMQGNKQPPQEAFTACSGKIVGSTCSFSVPNNIIMGTCQKPPNQILLVCVPNKRPQ